MVRSTSGHSHQHGHVGNAQPSRHLKCALEGSPGEKRLYGRFKNAETALRHFISESRLDSSHKVVSTRSKRLLAGTPQPLVEVAKPNDTNDDMLWDCAKQSAALSITIDEDHMAERCHLAFESWRQSLG